ncbi:MAG: hypothetical protein RXR16_03645 [Thermocladium sp.]
MQSNENKKKHNVSIKLSHEAYITARVLSDINGISVKSLLTNVLEKWLQDKRREALTKIAETLQTNNNNNDQTSDAESVSDTGSGKSGE